MERSDWGDDDPRHYRQPLPPEDRIWRHPSEMATVAPGGAGPAAGGRGRRRVGLVVAVGAAGALVIAGFADAALRPGGDDATTVTSLLLAPATTLARVTTAVSAAQPATTPAPEPLPTTAAAPATAAPAETTAATTVLATPEPDAGIVRLVATGAKGPRGAAAVAIDSAGTLVTSIDAVRGAEQIVVVLPDAQAVPATLVGVDETTGTAVLRVDAPTTPARTGKAASLHEGSKVTTQWAGGQWGTVSEMGAKATSSDGTPMKHLLVVELDVSGGWAEGDPLLDDGGSVVALCTQDADGRLLGVPIELAQAAARSVATSGKVSVPWLGIGGQDADGSGAKVGEVKASSPAEAAGIQVGDVVVRIDDQPITSVDGLVLTLRSYAPGATIAVTVTRDGAPTVLQATLTEQPADT